MNRYRIHVIVERIRRAGEFPFNVEDVQEELETVLEFYGIHEWLAPDEEQSIRGALTVMAEAEESAEAARMAGLDPLDALLGRG